VSTLLEQGQIFISNAFCSFYVGMKAVKKEYYAVWLNSLQIGKIDLKSYVFESTLSSLGKHAK